MEKILNNKDKAKQIHKRFKACSYDNKLYNERFCPDKKNIKEYHKFIDEINLHNKFYGYLVRIELL